MSQRARTFYRALAVWFVTLGIVACAPPQIFLMRDRTIEKPTLLLPPEATREPFLYKVPQGQLDVVFVVDNSRTFIDWVGKADATDDAHWDFYRKYFLQPYEGFLNYLHSNRRTENVNYNVHTITTTDTRPQIAPVATRDSGPNDQIQYLFRTSARPHGILLPKAIKNNPAGARATTLNFPDVARSNDLRERPRPYGALLDYLKNPAFKKRTNVPLVLVFFVGREVDESDRIHREDLIKSIAAQRGPRWIYSLLVLRASPGGANRTGTCDDNGFEQPTNFIDTFENTPWVQSWKAEMRKSPIVDVCDPSWHRWSDDLKQMVEKPLTRYRLGWPPKDPKKIYLHDAGGNTYSLDRDFTYDATNNEIVFLRDDLPMREGTLFFVSYQRPDPAPSTLPDPGTP